MAEILKGEESLDNKGSLDEVGDTNFKKLTETEMGKDLAPQDQKVDMVNGAPARYYLL